jgi:hypothetical protein
VPVSERPYTVKLNSEKSFYARSRIKADLPAATKLINDWSKKDGYELRELRKADYMTYYNAVKKIDGKENILYIVMAIMPDDPGNVHVSFRTWEKPDKRKSLVEDAAKAEQFIWADGRKVEGR